MSDLLDPQPLFEAVLTVWPEGPGRGRGLLSTLKLDDYDAATMDLIFKAGVDALTVWMLTFDRSPNAIIGDGGPTVVRLRARVYELLAEVAALKGETR